MPSSHSGKKNIAGEMTPDERLRTAQLCDLRMLKELVRICDEHGFTYYLSAGTLLGAVRHGGFIPWDDDIDVRMPREDYEKLLRVLPDELSPEYRLGHFYYGQLEHVYVLRLYDRRVKIERINATKTKVTPAWISVLPLDGMPEGKIRQWIRKKHLLWRRMWLMISVFDEIVTVKKKRRKLERVIISLVQKTGIQKKVSWRKNWQKLDRAMKKYPAEGAKLLINTMSTYKYKDIMPREIYGSGKMYRFEDAEFRGPEKADEFLTKLYGDYMELPPVEKRNHHMSEVVYISPELKEIRK